MVLLFRILVSSSLADSLTNTYSYKLHLSILFLSLCSLLLYTHSYSIHPDSDTDTYIHPQTHSYMYHFIWRLYNKRNIFLFLFIFSPTFWELCYVTTWYHREGKKRFQVYIAIDCIISTRLPFYFPYDPQRPSAVEDDVSPLRDRTRKSCFRGYHIIINQIPSTIHPSTHPHIHTYYIHTYYIHTYIRATCTHTYKSIQVSIHPIPYGNLSSESSPPKTPLTWLVVDWKFGTKRNWISIRRLYK